MVKRLESECVEYVENGGWEESDPKLMGEPGVKKFIFKAIDSGCE